MPHLRTLLISLTSLGWLIATSAVCAQTYGSQMMSPEERAAHRQTMRSLPPAEREAYRTQHHQEMQKQAKEAGTSIPDEPPAWGMGQGRGYGPGWDRRHRWGRGTYGPGRFGYGRRHGSFGPWGPGHGWGRGGDGPWGSGWGRGGDGPWGSGWGRGGNGPWGSGWGRRDYGPRGSGWGRRGYGPWGSGWGRSW